MKEPRNEHYPANHIRQLARCQLRRVHRRYRSAPLPVPYRNAIHRVGSYGGTGRAVGLGTCMGPRAKRVCGHHFHRDGGGPRHAAPPGVHGPGGDTRGDGRRAANKAGRERLSETAAIPAAKFAMMARTYLRERGASVEEMANVAVKNHGNAARNPFAQFRKPRTLEQVLASPRVVGDLTVQQCCPRGEGAAAVMVVSGNAIRKLGLDARRCVRVKASVAGSERPEAQYGDSAVELVRTSAQAAFDQAGIAPKELDLLELHDAFSVEELLYSEAIGVCDSGEGARYLARGDSQIGGRCAINASGGLIGMGHPLGP